MSIDFLKNIDAVAFDLDGTLVDSLPDLSAAANAMRHALGMSALTTNVLNSFVGDGLARLVHRALTNDYHGQAEERLWEKGFDLYVRHYQAHLADHSRPYPQVVETLDLLKTLQLPLVVITNKNEAFAVSLLKQLHLAERFSLILGGDSLSEKKPSALPLVHAAEVLGIMPQNLLMVGDSKNDILAARAAGAAVIAVTFGYGDIATLQQQNATRADAVIDHFIDIYQMLKQAKNDD